MDSGLLVVVGVLVLLLLEEEFVVASAVVSAKAPVGVDGMFVCGEWYWAAAAAANH